MKRRILLFMMTALLSVGAWAESLWTGSETLNYYGFQLTEAKSMTAGDVLTFTVSETTTGWAGIKLKTNDMTQGYATPGTDLISTSAVVGTVKIVVTSEVAEAATANGLWLDGNDCTVTSVDLEQKQATLNLYSNEEGTTVSYWGSGLSKAMFGAVQTGDLLTVTIKSVGADWGANLKVTTKDSGDGNVELATASISPDALPTTVTIPFTDDMVAAAKSNGLYLNEGTYTYTSVDLKYSYVITIDGGITNGTVTASKSKAVYGETVTLTVTPNDNYELGTLTVKDANDATVSTSGSDGTYSFTMPATAVTVNATFTESDNSETLTPTSTSNADEDVAAAFESVYTLGTGTDAKTLTIKVEKTEVSENSGTYKTNGTISASATTTGDATTVTLTPNPATGYKLSKLIIEKTADAGSANARTRTPATLATPATPATGDFITATKKDDGTWTFQMPDNNDVIISAKFAEKPQKPTLDYNKATRTITITNEAGSAGKLHYKLNSGDVQTTTGASASEVITVNTTVTAWITNISDDDDKSVEVTETFNVAAQPTVTYNEDDNTVSLALTAVSTTNTADSKLYYTTDGTNPTTTSTAMTADGDIDITEDMTTIKALALDTDDNYSEIVEQTVAYAYYLTASKEWNTYYSPKTFSVPDGLKAYTVTSVTAPANGESGTVVVAEQTVIAKDTPMLIYNENAGTTDKYRVYTTTDQTITEGIANEFKGVDVATPLPIDGKLRYVLVDGVFLRTTGGTLPANRCYLEFGSAAAEARSFSITVGDKTTAIESVGITTQEGEDQWYDLQGHRVMQPQKGIYIRNGKKVVVR